MSPDHVINTEVRGWNVAVSPYKFLDVIDVPIIDNENTFQSIVVHMHRSLIVIS